MNSCPFRIFYFWFGTSRFVAAVFNWVVDDDDDDFMYNDASTHWVICVYKVMFYYLKCKIYLNCTSKRLCYSLKICIVLSTFGCLKRTRMEKFKIVNGLRFKRFRFC